MPGRLPPPQVPSSLASSLPHRDAQGRGEEPARIENISRGFLSLFIFLFFSSFCLEIIHVTVVVFSDFFSCVCVFMLSLESFGTWIVFVVSLYCCIFVGRVLSSSL